MVERKRYTDTLTDRNFYDLGKAKIKHKMKKKIHRHLVHSTTNSSCTLKRIELIFSSTRKI